MPWYNGDYPPSYKNQSKYLREKAVEIANEVLKTTRQRRRSYCYRPEAGSHSL
jgi:uncharacterized protein YdaT